MRLGINTLLPYGLIRYTTDGSIPTSGANGHGTLAGNVDIVTLSPGSWTVKAIAYDPTGVLSPSSVVTWSFTVQATADTSTFSADPVIQPVSGTYNVLKRTQDGQFWYNVCSRNRGASFRATLDGTDPDFNTGNGVVLSNNGVAENYLNFYSGASSSYTLKVRAKLGSLPQSNVVTANITLVDK
jgi:hypothetical protein